MKSYRNYKGQYITRATHEKQILSRFYVCIFGLVCMAIVGVIGNTRGMEVIVPQAEASYKIPDWDPCGLAEVVCENEEPVQHAITAVSEALGRDVTDETKRRIKYLYERATEASVPFYDAVKTVYCESQWYAIKSWLPEESYGLSQIHLPSHGITKEQALDPHFALDFLVDNWKDTKWYGYNRNTGKCTNGLIINL